MNENETNKNTAEKGFFSKLSDGDFGLAKTYWLYNVLVGVVANILIKLITSTELLVVVSVATIAYLIVALIGLWKSASKYEGRKIWAVLAKIATIIGVISNIVVALIIVSLLLTNL